VRAIAADSSAATAADATDWTRSTRSRKIPAGFAPGRGSVGGHHLANRRQGEHQPANRAPALAHATGACLTVDV